MKFYPVTIVPRFLCFIFFAFMLIISCTKDTDLFENTVLDESSKTVIESVKETSEDEETDALVEEAVDEEDIMDPMVEKIYEARTTVFPVINDAHLQGDIGFNQNLVRLEEGRRTSYLMFDLSPIDSIGGMVNSSSLEFTVESDGGNGTISVFKAISNNWSEEDLSAKNAPETEVLVGEIATQYELGQTHKIALDTALVSSEVLTLILEHQEGNDLAFASKEHPGGKGPTLVVTYNAPQDAEAIVFDDAPEIELQGEDPTGPTTTDTTDESTEENTKEEPSGEEVTPDEETSSEETTEVESTDEESTNDETEDKETKEEEPTNDETKEETTESEESTEEESQDEETAEEKPTEEETTEEEVTEEETTEEEATEEETNNEPDAPQNEAPNAVAEASPSNGDAPLKVNFKGNSSSDDLGVKNYIWDFRDGSTSTETNPTHTFEKTGTLEVRLTVTDDQGVSDTDTVTITINEKEENKAPKAVATASPTSGEATLEVQFKGSSSSDDTEIKKYFWDFKDGSTATNSNPSHSFSTAGTYEVELSVTDEDGLTDTETVTIKVNETENKAPEAKASGSPLTGDAPLDVQFNASNSKDDNGVTGYFWDFKDGSTTTSKNPSHIFSEPGEYEVELSVKDAEGLTDATTIKVTVNQRPVDNGGDSSDNGGNDNGGGDDNSGGSGSGNNGGGSGSDNGDGSSSGNSGNYPSNAVFASSFGFKSGDATAAFEAAIKSGKSYVVIDKQSNDWVIRPAKFFDLKNMTIVFEKGVVLKAKSGAFSSSDELFQMVRAQNVKIEGSGATFDMNNGQGGHALSITQSTNIEVSGLTLKESGGDGLYIAGGSSSGSFSKDITIDNVVCTDNRRHGMTIISAQDVYIRNSKFLKSSGSTTEVGVDLEPNDSRDRLVNINFSNCTFADNDSSGFVLGTRSLTSSSTPISVLVKNSTFSSNDRSPASTRPRTQLQLSQGSHADPVKGEIRFEGVEFNGGNKAIFSKLSAISYKVVFKNCVAKNVAKDGSDPVIELQALSVAKTMGGFTFENFHLEYDSDVPFMRLTVPYNDVVKDIKGNFTIDQPNDRPLQYTGGYDSDDNVNVSINYKHVN